MKLLILPLIIGLIACNKRISDKSTETEPRAIQLNDSATKVYQSLKKEDILRAISLLDEATAIDSNFFIAYWNKLAFQNELKLYDNALQTAKRIERLNPDVPLYTLMSGILYELSGDSTSALVSYRNSLNLFDSMLDTMNEKNMNFTLEALNKGVNLLLLGYQEEGNIYLSQLYNKTTDTLWKEQIAVYMNKSRDEIINEIRQGE